MVWTAPTLQQFRDRFPEFVNRSDGNVQAVLDEAVGEVGDTWIESDRTPAVLHLTAHLLASSGTGVGAGGGGVAVTGPIRSRTVGDVSVTFAGAGSTKSDDLLATTGYGRRYLALMRKNFPAVSVV